MDGKKKFFLLGVIIICVAIFLVLTIINYQKEENPTSKSPKTTKLLETEGPEVTETNKLQTVKEYEEIIRNFYQAKNFAIEKGEDSFLNDFLEKGNEYTNKVLSDVKNKNKVSYKVIIFKEVKNINENVITILVEIDGKNVLFKIKDVKGKNYLIIDEKIN
jgi:hypothetical protein